MKATLNEQECPCDTSTTRTTKYRRCFTFGHRWRDRLDNIYYVRYNGVNGFARAELPLLKWRGIWLPRVIVTSAVYPRFFEFLHVDIQFTGQKLHYLNQHSRGPSQYFDLIRQSDSSSPCQFWAERWMAAEESYHDGRAATKWSCTSQ